MAIRSVSLSAYAMLAGVVLLAASAVAGAAETRGDGVLYLNTGVRQPWTRPDKGGFLDRLVAEAFRRIGRTAEVAVYPSAERAMINANAGLDDGAAMRVAGIEAQYPDLLRVDEKVVDNDFVAYSVAHRFETRSFADLRPYQVAHIVGWKVFERQFDATYHRTIVQNADQLFGLLASGRADVVLYERWQGLTFLAEKGIAAAVLEPPLASTPMFMYLHRSHADLLEPVAAALRAMKADGAYERIAAETLAPPAAGR